MFSSTNEVAGFSAVGQKELEAVNGGEPITFFLIGVTIGAAITGALLSASK